MKTELIIFHRPFNSILSAPSQPAFDLATGSNYTYTLKNNINKVYNKAFQQVTRTNSNSTGGISLDLFDNVSIPVTYTILDVREPEKRKTSWSKTITIPGTKNNNRVFDHIYELGQDGWITIGNTSVYEGFNPNLRLECIILNDGVQTLKGNLQLKKIAKDSSGNIQYEIAISGDLTSLFFDVGTAKLSDLDLGEWDHAWTKESIEKSWQGISLRDGQDYNSIVSGTNRTISRIYQNTTSGRLTIETSTNHGLILEDWVKIEPDLNVNANFMQVRGEWQVVEVISITRFSVNYFYPVGLLTSGYTGTLGTIAKRTATGRGYVYPMISWGDEYDYNSFPVTSFVPGVYIKEVWDKIFEETKSSYSSTFLNSQFFKRMILIQKKSSYDLNPSEYRSRKFWVGSTQSYLTGAAFSGTSEWKNTQITTTSTATASIYPQTNITKFPFKSESGGFGTVSFYDNGLEETSSYGNWNNDTYKWVVQDTGEYDLTTCIKLTAWCDMNGTGYNPGTGTSSFNLSTYRYYPGGGGQNYNNAYTSGPGPYAATDPNQFGMQVKATIKLLRDGVVTTIGENVQDFKMNNQSYYQPTNENWINFGRYQPVSWRNQELTVTTTTKYFKEGDEVWVELTHFVQAYASGPIADATLGRKSSFSFNQSGGPEIARAVIGEWFLRVDGQSFIYNSPSPRTIEGATIPMTSVLPKDMECKDFLLAVIKMFNLHIEQDRQVDRKYYIEPRDDYYYDGSSTSHFVDLTDQIDANSVEMTPLGELIAKYYVFENKEESDYWNKRFKEDRGRAYQYYRKEINNDFLKNETKISIPLGSTVMINNPEGSDVVMPSIIQRESNGSFKPVSNSQPRILIWGGLRPYSAQRGGAKINLNNALFPNQFGWELLSGSQSAIVSASASIYNQYPYAGTVDSPADPIRDINWYNMEEGDFVYYDNARWSNENLYNKYWSNFINEISDPTSKVISCFVKLTPQDIFDIDFRKIYIIDGHWLRLQKVIDYDPISDGLTKCEFLKLKSPTKFKRESIIVDSFGSVNSVFSQNTDTTRPVGVTTTMIAPPRKRPDLGFNNTTTGVNLSNSVTIQTNGLSNFVGPGSKNITITGNENAIGDFAENIQISGGSGNFITGGVRNVNIIGTDKKFIDESNVTYINGIRYVNGVAVSKSNVINGGIDVALIRQSFSTTPNVVNAGEDVVITAGSSAFENVVNGGKDRILPDLPELGIATLVNPNPRTNLTSGYESRFATQSIIEVIRSRSELR
jgi:hypothetical protein